MHWAPMMLAAWAAATRSVGPVMLWQVSVAVTGLPKRCGRSVGFRDSCNKAASVELRRDGHAVTSLAKVSTSSSIRSNRS